MHIDKSIGTLFLLWPTYWASWIAFKGTPDADIFIAFTVGTFSMRSAGCVVNDLADCNPDGAVERTKNRPFARGLVSKTEALLLIAMLCPVAALYLVPPDRSIWLTNLPTLFLAVTYPFTKRSFPLPQFYLGLVFPLGIPMAFAVVQGQVSPEARPMLTVNVLWTLAYDMIYAMADKEDDLKIGIKTSAIIFGHHDISVAMLCHLWLTVLMAVLGIRIDATWPYRLVLPITTYQQCQQYAVIRTRDRQLCFQISLASNRIGLAWSCRLICHYFWLFLVSKLFQKTRLGPSEKRGKRSMPDMLPSI